MLLNEIKQVQDIEESAILTEMYRVVTIIVNYCGEYVSLQLWCEEEEEEEEEHEEKGFTIKELFRTPPPSNLFKLFDMPESEYGNYSLNELDANEFDVQESQVRGIMIMSS